MIVNRDATPERPRILHATYWFAIATTSIANAQSERHEIMMIATRKDLVWVADDKWQDVFDPRIRLRVERDRRRCNPLYYVDRFLGFHQGLHRFQPSVVHLQGQTDTFVMHAYLRMKRFPLVYTVHDPFYAWVVRLWRTSLGFCSLTAFVSS